MWLRGGAAVRVAMAAAAADVLVLCRQEMRQPAWAVPQRQAAAVAGGGGGGRRRCGGVYRRHSRLRRSLAGTFCDRWEGHCWTKSTGWAVLVAGGLCSTVNAAALGSITCSSCVQSPRGLSVAAGRAVVATGFSWAGNARLLLLPSTAKAARRVVRSGSSLGQGLHTHRAAAWRERARAPRASAALASLCSPSTSSMAWTSTLGLRIQATCTFRWRCHAGGPMLQRPLQCAMSGFADGLAAAAGRLPDHSVCRVACRNTNS